MKQLLTNRVKASVVSLAMAASAIPLCTVPVNAATPSGMIVQAENVGLSQTMKVDSVYKGTFPTDGADSVTFKLSTSYSGQSFSYGFGCSTADSPYWLELDKSGKWMEGGAGSKVEGTACKLDKATSEITIDLKKAGIKPGGSFEFRCYYSAHWDNSKGDMVNNSVTLTGVDFSGGSSSSDGPSLSSKNKKSGSWSFKDNKDGTATISSTVSKQLDELDYKLTVGYDEDYYAGKGVEPDKDDPINSHKFKYSDFGISETKDITIESLYVVVESDFDVDKFMYGCGTNVAEGSPADTEYAKRGIIKGKDKAGYWYNEMGEESREEFEEQGVEFGLKSIGEGTTLEGAGKYIECLWDVPADVQKYQTTGAGDSIGFQFWYGTKDAAKYTEITEKDPLTITSAVLTYTITKTIPYTGSTKTSVGKSLDCTASSDSKKNLEVDYSDLDIKSNMKVYAIRFDVSAKKDIKKLVYGTGTGTTKVVNDYWYQEPVNSVVLEAGKKAEIMWVLPNEVVGDSPAKNCANPDGKIVFGYYYGESDAITVDNVEVYYYEEEEPSLPEVTLWGDANCDNGVDLSDAVIIMQSLANPNKYGLNGTDLKHITLQGTVNGDVCENGNGITSADASSIQRKLLGLIPSLPESYKK
ncbi:MAG: DUF5620 domain-containing protein [Ruminococcus sp.]|uniref:DUF5620 domain-containing protein n=1 Tax=Ruminococcus sp. TaxID=41978 RepID=UPI0025E0932D|nr:DUF5620 domain-containing protein [Ruminococcus sp.]MCR5599747.1 DUF5620 domain-containing protein [Ruminococcus sp.]